MTAQPGAPTPAPLLGFMLRDALRLLHTDFRRRVTERGFKLTPALYRLLFRLQRNPGCRQVELADFLEVTPVTVGRMVDRLEKRRLVRRGRHPEDRRAIRVFLDRRGSELMTKLEEVARLTEECALEGFSARERATLRHALARVHANLTAAP